MSTKPFNGAATTGPAVKEKRDGNSKTQGAGYPPASANPLPPRSKLFGGERFTEGEVIPIRGIGFRIVSLTRRGIVLRKPTPGQNTAMSKEEWIGK